MAAPAHGVVIGASIAGLLAATALSEACAQVTIYERDTLPAEPGPRRGVPQSRQFHAIQARSVLALEELLPGFRGDLLAAGAVTTDMQGDIHWFLDDYLLKTAHTGLEGMGISRPVLEWLIRARVAKLPGVTIADGTDVVRLVTAGDGGTGSNRVTGVVTRAARTHGAAEQAVTADLVVDAAGRGSRTPAWLTELGRVAPETSQVRARLTYVSRIYRRDPKQLDGRFGSLCTPYPGRAFGGGALRMEGDRWIVVIVGMDGTEPPDDDAGMIAFADRFACPDIATVMRESEPLSEAMKYTFPESTRYHYERDYLGGLLVIGDAYSSFNPIYGQGITIAALEALVLRRLLTGAGGVGTSIGAQLERDYFKAAGKLVDGAWEVSASSDLRFPEIAGKRRPGAGLVDAYLGKLRAAATIDPTIGRDFLRVSNMMDSPAKLLSPGMMLRVFRSARKAVRAS